MTEKVANEKNLSLEIRKYLENPPTKNELKDVIKTLNIRPIDLVRTKELVWKENFKGKQLNDDQIIEAMINFPKLIERPVVIYKNKAILARPSENVLILFK